MAGFIRHTDKDIALKCRGKFRLILFVVNLPDAVRCGGCLVDVVTDLVLNFIDTGGGIFGIDLQLAFLVGKQEIACAGNCHVRFPCAAHFYCHQPS